MNETFTYRQFLMCIWLISVKYVFLTSWEKSFLKSILSKKTVGDKITHRQDFKIWQIYEKNRRPREYYASTHVCMGEYYNPGDN